MRNLIFVRRLSAVAMAFASVVCLGSSGSLAAEDGFNPFEFDPNSPYVTVYGGGSVLNDDDVMQPGFDSPGDNYHSVSYPGFLVGGVLGIRLNDYIRTEGELSFSRWTHDYVETWLCPPGSTERCSINSNGYERLGTGGSTNAFNFFGNAWLDIGLLWGFSIYGGGGVGFTLLAYKDQFFGVDRQDVSFAWQFGSGIRYQLTDNILIDARWVRRGPIRPDYGPLVHEPFEILSDSATLGATFEF